MLDSIIVRYSNILFSYSTSVRKTLQKTIRPNLRKSKNYFDALPKKARSRQWQLWDQEFLIKYVRFIPWLIASHFHSLIVLMCCYPIYFTCFCKIIVSFDSDLISFWRIWIFAFVMLQIIYRRRRLTSHEKKLDILMFPMPQYLRSFTLKAKMRNQLNLFKKINQSLQVPCGKINPF